MFGFLLPLSTASTLHGFLLTRYLPGCGLDSPAHLRPDREVWVGVPGRSQL